jgi:DNA-directed RNA polymerase subunit RPC12/RpoP
MKKKYRVSKTTLTTQMIKSDEQLDGVMPPTIYHCENCGVPVITYHIKNFKFCLNCGAKIVSKRAKKQ